MLAMVELIPDEKSAYSIVDVLLVKVFDHLREATKHQEKAVQAANERLFIRRAVL